ncbi:MAG: cytochrome c [Herbiconiux sp.]|nr:cytochrome c [Herbiconiux sp.]
MLIAVFVLLWVSVLAAGAAIYGVRPQAPGVAWGRWVGPAAAVSFLGLAIGLPALAVVYSGGERKHRTHSGLVLTDAQVHGREIFTRTCIRCHTLADIGAASTVGPSFDRLRPDALLIEDAVKNGRARGRGQMPAGLANAEGARDVADYLVAVAGHEAGP